MTRMSRPQKHAYLSIEGGRAPNSGQHDPLGLSPILIHWQTRGEAYRQVGRKATMLPLPGR